MAKNGLPGKSSLHGPYLILHLVQQLVNINVSLHRPFSPKIWVIYVNIVSFLGRRKTSLKKHSFTQNIKNLSPVRTIPSCPVAS